VEWFFGLSGNAASWFSDMVKVAVVSALSRTTLEPHCIYDGDENPLTEWLERRGVVVHRAVVPFVDELYSVRVTSANAGSLYKPANARGHFLRLLVSDFAQREHALYTDCDVMFANNPVVPLPESIAAVAEVDRNLQPSPSSFNSGVMAINTIAWERERAALVADISASNFYDRRNSSYDQVFLNRHFRSRWDEMSAALNWRPFQSAIEGVEPSIVHFHGPKPTRIPAILAGRASQTEGPMLRFIEANRPAYAQYAEQFAAFLKAA
jgi:hypothetical protein